MLKRAEDAGVAAIVYKSLFEEQIQLESLSLMMSWKNIMTGMLKWSSCFQPLSMQALKNIWSMCVKPRKA